MTHPTLKQCTPNENHQSSVIDPLAFSFLERRGFPMKVQMDILTSFIVAT